MKQLADEASFQDSVLAVASLTGWRSLHIRPARRADGSWRTPIGGDGKGWPDLTLVRPPRLVFCELKSPRGTLRPEQRDWLDRLRLLPQAEVYLWTPESWDELVEVLTGTPLHQEAT
jgi:VRR-NUC domain